MILRRITLHDVGAVDQFEYGFENVYTVVKSRYTNEISYAIRLVLGHRVPPLPESWARGDTKIEALVSIAGEAYRLVFQRGKKQKNPCLRAYDGRGNDVTGAYFYLVSHCAEQDLSEAFDGDADKVPFRLAQYIAEDRYDDSKELSWCTERMMGTKFFRSYVRSFVKDFQPEPIHAGKRYELQMEVNGRYIVRYKDDSDAPVFLSESEQTLFRYLCFLRTAEFWHGFEEIRNLNCVKKPILVENFLEKLDESVDTSDLVRRSTQLNRQIIMLTT